MSQYRQNQCQLMLEAVDRAGVKGVTRAEFAALLGIKKGKHLNGLIAELISRNLAVSRMVKDIHNRNLFIYLKADLVMPLPEIQS